MDLTTTARVLAFKGWAAGYTESPNGISVDRDTWIGVAITAWSKRFEREARIEAEQKERTEVFSVEPSSLPRVRLSAYPVASISSVKNTWDRDFASATAFASTAYDIDTENGVLTIDRAGVTPGHRVLQVVYTGGMGTSATNFAAAYPDIADAVDQQVAFSWEQRERLGQTSVSGPDGSVTLFDRMSVVPAWTSAVRAHRRLI